MTDRLIEFPYIVVRLQCEACGRDRRHRLARLAERFGADMQLDELLPAITKDCPRRELGTCRAYFRDITRRPADLPRGLKKPG